MLDYTDNFLYVEPSLHLWDEADLIIVDDFCVIGLCLLVFIEYFCINVHEGDLPVIFFLG